MADFFTIAILSFFGWSSANRRDFIGVLLCIALGIALGVSHG